ncbi:MAG: ATP-binding protein, partial [Anaerolineae bacterium]|nr:ATP-binding protein [Anaerolineae bacterium]
GQLSLHPQSVQPRDLLEHTLLLYASQAEQKKINLGLQLPPADLPAVTMDLDRMVQVLGNLISNAIRHTPAGGAIQLAAQPDPRGVQIAVTDSGAGINPEDLPHVFDRFYRGNKARSDSGESGLGLAIARSIVAAHGGQIAVASTLGQGTTFTITLPPQNQ